MDSTLLTTAEKLQAIKQYSALIDPNPIASTIKQFLHTIPTKQGNRQGALVSIKEGAITIDSKTFDLTKTETAALACTLLAVLQDIGFFCSPEACPNEHYTALTIRAMIDAMIDENERVAILEADYFG